jgi:hypothetical protein
VNFQRGTRATSPSAKADVLRALADAWERMPGLRLGQLLENANTSPTLFYAEDGSLADDLENYGRKGRP